MTETICLNMIVKDERHVIGRCLESVKGLIDHGVIVDTGSTDGTPEFITETLAGIPGELHHRPWRDFGTNRSEALELARGTADFMLIIDADEQLVVVQEVNRVALGTDLTGAVDAIREAVLATHGVAPLDVLLVEPMQVPTTTSGKIQRRACREQYLAGELTVLAQWAEPRPTTTKPAKDGKAQGAALLGGLARLVASGLAQRARGPQDPS